MMAPSVSEASMYTEETHLTSFEGVTDNTIHFSNGSANSSIDCTNGDLSNENMALRQYGTPISITGGHEVTIGRYVGCDIRAEGNETAQSTTLNIDTDTTLTVVGADNHSTTSDRPWADGTFVIGRMNNKTATVNVEGTLNIRNATISADDASGILNIKSGGTVNVKSLGTWNRNSGTVTVKLEDGGVLNLGEGGIANKDKLNLNLNGGTIGIDGANGATGWTSSKALQLNGDVTFNTTVQNSSQQAGTITLNSLNANGHTLTAAGDGRLTVESLSGSIGGISLGAGTTLNLTLNGNVDVAHGETSIPTENGFITQSVEIENFLTKGENSSFNLNTDAGHFTIWGIEATLDTESGTLSANSYTYAVVSSSGDSIVSLTDVPSAGSSSSDLNVRVYEDQSFRLDGALGGTSTGDTPTLAGLHMEDGTTLYLAGGASLSSAPSVAYGATINVTVDANASVTWDAGATITTGNGIGTLTLGQGSTLHSGVLFGNSNATGQTITMEQDSTWNISGGTNTLSGATIQTQGTGASTITGGTLSLSGTTTLNTADAESTLTITSGVTSAALTKTGAGTVTIENSVTINGKLTLGERGTDTDKTLLNQGGTLELKGTTNTIRGSMIDLKDGTLITHGTTTISDGFDASGGRKYTGRIVVADGVTTISGAAWVSAENLNALSVQDGGELVLKDVRIQALNGREAHISGNGDANINGHADLSVLNVSDANIIVDSQNANGTLSFKLDSSKLTNERSSALVYNGTATDSDFVNASTGTTQVGKAANNVTLKGNGATATGVTTSDSGFAASSVSTVAGTATTFTGNVTVTGSLTAAAMTTSADFISTGEVTGISSTSGRQVLFASDSASAIQSTFQSTGSGTTLTLGDGATLTLGGALAASDGNTFTLTLGGKVTLDFTTEVKAAIADLSMGTTLDVLLATNVNFGDGTSLLSGATASDYITLASDSGLALTDSSQLILNGDNLLLTGAVTVPEPATATLSLLALAALCARRRRKA